MTILHITSEFTKKNFSIASLIVYISNYLHSKFDINFSILASHYEKELFDNKNTETIKFDNFFNFFFKIRTLKNKISNYEIIHIHGIWAPIQVISIVICNFYRKNYVVHPHGMLLHEALKSTGTFKYFLKKLFLFFFKYLISNKAKFLAITNQEYNAIKFFFPSNKINIISNPIPFEKQDIKLSIKKKQFVYFGRVHPHIVQFASELAFQSRYLKRQFLPCRLQIFERQCHCLFLYHHVHPLRSSFFICSRK